MSRGRGFKSLPSQVAMESDDPSIVLKGVDDLEIVLKLSPTSSIALYCMG